MLTSVDPDQKELVPGLRVGRDAATGESMRRRDLLRWAGLGTIAGVVRPHTVASSLLGVPEETTASSAFDPDVELALSAELANVPILPGAPTRVWRYAADLIQGPAGTIDTLPDTYLGPVLRLKKGQRVRVRFTNRLPEPTIVHWHGLDVPASMDGHPHLVVPPAASYLYEFTVINRAGTYWYHPHHHNRTGPQAYQGLAGLLVVSDDEEEKLKLPGGAQEILCVVQDRTFDHANQLTYGSGMSMDHMSGFLGARVLVNGRTATPLSLATRTYRIRFLNGSNSRVYKLAWSDGTPMTVIGTDGGLLEAPLQRSALTLAPGERADVILDLSACPVGTALELRSLAFPQRPFEMAMGMGRMGGGMGRGRSGGPGGLSGAVPANGAPLSILSLRVDRRENAPFVLPRALSTFDASWRGNGAAQPSRVVSLGFRHMQWLLDNRTFEMVGVAADETVTAGSTHVWEFQNTEGMMGMRLAHPMHLHGRQFRVVDRQIGGALRADWSALRDGFTDEGWKDTVLVMPGERVRILVRFTGYRGLYLYHCHNLEHEDMGMMRNYRVV
jgi:FtsP/CotA-like multicopper oxidase with cupredoxin domain